jgi:hypothetical protein
MPTNRYAKNTYPGVASALVGDSAQLHVQAALTPRKELQHQLDVRLGGKAPVWRRTSS